MNSMPQPVNDPVVDVTHSAHQKVRAMWDKMKEADQQLGHVRKELDKLTGMGDMVTEDDVIQAAGRLVGHGLGAETMAEMLVGMPSQPGQALAAWVEQQDATVTQHEFVLKHSMIGVQHELGQAGLRVLAAEHLKGAGQPSGSSQSTPTAPPMNMPAPQTVQ